MHHELLEAYKSFWLLVQKYPSHPTAESSAHLILDILNRKQDFPKLIAACQRFLQNKSFAKPEFRAEIADVLRHAELKRIQLIEKSGEFEKAAREYVEYTKQYGEQDLNLYEKALYNASVNFTKANSYLAAVETQEQFLRTFPKSTLRQEMLLQVAKTYELFANFEKAASYFEQFATGYPKHVQAANALRLAGLYYWGAGYATRAEGVMIGFFKKYPEKAKEVQRDLMEVFEASGATEKQVAFLNQMRLEKGVSFSDQLHYSVRIAELEGKKRGKLPTRLMEEALELAERNASSISSARGKEAFAKILFWQASRQESQFANIKLVLPQAQMARNMQKKLELLKALEAHFGRVVKLGAGEWGIGAMYKTAALYRHLAQEIQAAPIPNELSGEEVDNYRKELQKAMIKPFNEKALGLSAQCLDKAQEYNLLTAWTPRCYALASELQPDHYPMVRTFYLPPMQVALMLPDPKTSKVPVGNLNFYPYPYYSSSMFGISSERTPASAPLDIPFMSDSGRELSDVTGIIPASMNYRALVSTRKSLIKKSLDSEKPADLRKGSSFAYLNLMRLASPDKSLPAIIEAIQRDPSNPALHNLLGLAYLESGNLPAARVCWLALIARDVKHPAIWNNLGVVSLVSGSEPQALDFFKEAASGADQKEPLLNLAFTALKYRNGFEAKREFLKATVLDANDAAAQVGLAVGQLQNREMEMAKAAFLDLAKRFDRDPYLKLSLGYYLVDVERENATAETMLSKYMDGASLENDILFRQALQEAKHAAASSEAAMDGSLPTVGD